MTAPAEPDLDLSHLLVEAPVPQEGAVLATRTARRRHVVHRVAAGGVAIAVVVAVVAAATALRSNGGDRTLRTADAGITSTLLTTADVQRVLPDMVATPIRGGGDVVVAARAERELFNPPPRAEFMRQWSSPGRVQMVIDNVLDFGDEGTAIRHISDAAVRVGSGSSAFTAIPGATEFFNPAGTTRAVLFSRGRYVYGVSVTGGHDNANELHQLSIRQAELARAGPTTCPVNDPLTGNADALPEEGQTTLEHVTETITRYGPVIRKDFGGVTSLTVERRNGDVWSGINGGAYSVHRVKDYWIVVHLEQAVFCPGAPAAFHSYDGVPLHFVVG